MSAVWPGANVDSRGVASGDLLLFNGTTFARIAKGSTGQQLLVRSDGTVAWVDPSSISVKVWGAKGDGVTDDTNAVQAAITAATEVSGEVYFPPGVYLAAAVGQFKWYTGEKYANGENLQTEQSVSLKIAAGANIRFRGAGRGQSILKKTTLRGELHDYNMLCVTTTKLSQQTTLSFSDMGFDGGMTGSETPFTVGSDFHNLFLPGVTKLTIDKCAITNTFGGGAFLWNVQDVTVTNSLFELCGWKTSNNALTVKNAVGTEETAYGNVNVSDNTFTNCKAICLSVSAKQTPLDHVRIKGNSFRATQVGFGGSAVELLSPNVGAFGAGTLRDVIVAHNNFQGCAGIAVQGTDVTIAYNTMRNLTLPGGAGEGSTYAINFNNGTNSKRTKVVGNIIDGGEGTAILMEGVETTITENLITGWTTGIKWEGSGSLPKIVENVLSGNGTAIAGNPQAVTGADVRNNVGAEEITRAFISETILATNATLPVPPMAKHAMITVVGGGGGGGGGGSAAAAQLQRGGAGGTAGVASTQFVALGANTTLNVKVGAGGAGGEGGVAGGKLGENGKVGTASTVTGTGISVTGGQGGWGLGSAASSEATVEAIGYGSTSNEAKSNKHASEGGSSAATGGTAGPSSGGGGGGGAATATNGGGGGKAGTATVGGTGGASGASGTSAGLEGESAAANTAAGGGAGGGGAAGTGAGGKGGNGGSGFVTIVWLP
jgi:Pectate lyase superfamily protein